MVEQHVCRPRCVWATHGTNHRIRGQGGLEHLVLKPPVQQEGCRRRHQLVEGDKYFPVLEANLRDIFG